MPIPGQPWNVGHHIPWDSDDVNPENTQTDTAPIADAKVATPTPDKGTPIEAEPCTQKP